MTKIDIFEIVGRFGVFLTLLIILNRSSWYQSLPYPVDLNNGFVWAISLGIALVGGWVLRPTFN